MSNHPPHSIAAIVAMARNRVIGLNNQLPWHLPADLKHFKSITTGHAILMGRKTYESIGRPLPNRTNIILTRNADFAASGCLIANSFDAALKQLPSHPPSSLFVIGGAEIYHQLMPYVQTLYLTIVHQDFQGDTYFQALEQRDWKEVSREDHEADADNSYPYTFLVWKRV